MGAIKIPETVANLDLELVAKLLVKHNCNITKTAKELSVPITDLRKLTLSNPRLIDAAYEVAEKRLDKAEGIIDEALSSDSSSARAAAAFFVLKNMEKSRQRGWIPASSASNTNIDVNLNVGGPREVIYRWRTPEDAEREAERARIEAEREREERERIEAERKVVQLGGPKLIGSSGEK